MFFIEKIIHVEIKWGNSIIAFKIQFISKYKKRILKIHGWDPLLVVESSFVMTKFSIILETLISFAKPKSLKLKLYNFQKQHEIKISILLVDWETQESGSISLV